MIIFWKGKKIVFFQFLTNAPVYDMWSKADRKSVV